MSEDLLLPSEEEVLQELMESRESQGKELGVYLVSSDSPALEVAKSVERSVFEEKFAITEMEMAQEYDSYDPFSTFILAVDQQAKKPVAAFRAINYSPGLGFKSLLDIEKGPWQKPEPEVLQENDIHPESTWDIGTMAVMPEYRDSITGVSASAAIYHALYHSSVNRGIDTWIAVMDTRVLEYMNSLGIAFEPLKGLGSEYYLGSETTPIIGRVSELEEKLRSHPTNYDVIVKGSGIQDNVSFPEEIT